MTASSPQPTPADPLQPVLKDAEAELHRRLRAACEAEANAVSTDSAHEIRHLEDAIFAAAAAAQKSMKLRRQMERRASSEPQAPIRIDDVADRQESAEDYESQEPAPLFDEAGEKTDMSVREFSDDAGRMWRAWPVIPGQNRTSAKRRSFLGDFQDGWVCFEGVDIAARRRLPYRPPNWASMTDQELRRLLAEAIDARERAPERPTPRSD